MWLPFNSLTNPCLSLQRRNVVLSWSWVLQLTSPWTLKRLTCLYLLPASRPPLAATNPACSRDSPTTTSVRPDPGPVTTSVRRDPPWVRALTCTVWIITLQWCSGYKNGRNNCCPDCSVTVSLPMHFYAEGGWPVYPPLPTDLTDWRAGSFLQELHLFVN